MKTRIAKLVATVFALALLAGTTLWTSAPAPAVAAAPGGEARQLRVGVYDPRAIALAWSRSKHFTITTLIADAKAAKEKGDQARFEALKQQLVQAQERLHAQVFSDAPVDNLLAAVADKLPGVAAECRVDLIASGPVYAATGTQAATLDVTDAIVQRFEPDAKTLKTIAQLAAHPRVWRSTDEMKD